MMPNPPSPTVRPLSEMPQHTSAPIICYTVRTEFIDGLGQIATRSQLVYATHHSHVQAMMHDKHGASLVGMSIYAKSVKNCPSK